MKAQFARITVQVMLVSLLALFLIGCGESGGSSGSGSDVGSITITAEPQSLPADGSRTSTLTLNLIDSAGAAVEAGTSVRVKTNLGAILGSTQTADDSGVIILTFRSGTTPGVATIVAEADGARNEVDIELSGQDPASIDVAEGFPDPESINIKGTGGASSSRIVFDVRDASGAPVIDGYRVNLTITDGPDGGEKLEPTSAITLNGQVQTTLRSGTKSGPVSLKAAYDEDTKVSTTTSRISINSGPPVGEEFGIFAQYLNVSGLDQANLEDMIGVNVGDIYGNSVPDGTAISFKTYNTGGFFSSNFANTAAGIASDTLVSGGTMASPAEGFLTVTAETNNGGRSTHITDIAVNPVVTDVVYVGTDGGGVYKSTDKGASWKNVSRSPQEAGQNFIAPYVNDIEIKADEPNTVYAATGYLGGGNIYRSLDGGHTWRSENVEQFHGIFSVGSAVLSLVVDEGLPHGHVWAGTDGMGAVFADNGEDFRWGGRLVSGPYDPAPANSGTGNLTVYDNGFGPATKSETWSAEFQASSAVLVDGPDFFGANKLGQMENLSLFSGAGTQTWTARYTGGVSSVDESQIAFPASSELNVVKLGANPFNEQFVVSYVSPGDPEYDGEIDQFRVTGSISGVQGVVPLYENFTTEGEEGAGAVTFYVEGSRFRTGDKFVFNTYEDNWNVSGSESGSQGSAKTGKAFTSSNGGVSFTITGSEDRAYERGDRWTFETRATGKWQLVGSKSGVQDNFAQTGIPYSTDSGEVSFIIVNTGSFFEQGDDFVFEVQESGLGFGKIVREIVKTSGSGDVAVLYAATATGVYKSENGGRTWREVSIFDQDNIHTLAVHPDNSDTLYAGTKNAGLWYTINGGNSWQQASNEGLGEGLGASVPKADTGNIGTGRMSDVSVGEAAQDENWTVKYNASAGSWAVTGTLSGEQSNPAQTGSPYESDNGEIAFVIHEGDVAYGDNDQFTFSTTRDPGNNILALQPYADGSNNYLYAVTYFIGSSEPEAVGNVYVINLDESNLYAPSGVWMEANSNLPQYDPPEDTKLFPQHALAVDDPADPRTLFIGGEGINFYKASSGLTEKSPAWFESKAGLSNLIMARMPILFTDDCSMDITAEFENGVATFTVYIQDHNGNPPIAGSNFTAVFEPDQGDTVNLYDIDYPDTYTYQGTFRNPADSDTDNPYVMRVPIVSGKDKVIFTFTPFCNEDGEAPGCSGQIEERTYSGSYLMSLN